MYVNEISFRVRYSETDRMGIVYHPNYYIWFEIGRTDYMRSLGCNYRDIEEKGILLPVIETHCFYKKPARYDDVVTVKTALKEFKGVRLSFDYEIYNQKTELLSYGYTVQVFVDKNLKPVNIKKVMPDIYYKLISNK
ncbi:MAG: thioesterase family protein [Clostridiales bacterium]|nr:thioesterase family protein [Clostridiales bacterium]HBM81912.1 4-hydroxybenzoyl-CoA thioesterase [Clostridiaceae bacterium]